ncbi:MAG TPA: hypothetical protein VME45_00190 [Stellaceae bacterium]|nr:hypothetical protein [Stellaceae bacterium]
MLGRIAISRGRRARRLSFVATALIFAAVGAHSLNPRQLYREMYPLEPVKQSAFQICDQADPTFIRAIGSEREACYEKMPHVMAVAMGRVKPADTVTMESMIDPSREAKLLLALAAMPPQQPITEPRLFSNTAWVRALIPTCDAKPNLPAMAYTASDGLPPAAGAGRAAALDSVRAKLPLLPQPAQPGTMLRSPLPPIALRPPAPASGAENKAENKTAAFTPLLAPDIGDKAPPAIVPLAPSTACGGA